MNVLIAGVVLWTVAHLMPTLAAGFRQGLIDKLGAGPYRGVFALTVLASLVLIVFGWRATPEQYLYVLPAWTRSLSFILMMISVFLLGAANSKTAIKRYLRHPMLLGVFVWSLSHLLTNGTTRAVVLFGGLGLWALLEIPLINSRDGAREIPAAPGMKSELIGIAITAAVFVLLLFLHPYFAGVSPMPVRRVQ